MSEKDDEEAGSVPKEKKGEATRRPSAGGSGQEHLTPEGRPAQPGKPRGKKPADRKSAATFAAQNELLPSDEVGFGNPPRKHRFPPGVSGNPRGRPIGAKTRRFGFHGHRLYDCLNAELERPVKYTEGDEERQMPALQAVTRRVTLAALKGSTEAARIILHLARDRDNYERRQNERLMEIWGTHKTEVNQGIKAMGPNPTPDQLASIPLPHPDHIDMDMATGEIVINGPMTQAERQALEYAFKQRPGLQGALDWVAGEIKAARSPERLAELQEMQKMQKMLEERMALYNDILGDDRGGEDGGGESAA